MIPRAPPVRNVLAIHGVNRPTEVQQMYRRRPRIRGRDVMQPRYEVDSKTTFENLTLQPGIKYKAGIFYETKDRPQISLEDGEVVYKSGDGVVPYASLQHVLTWKDSCNVKIKVSI